MPDPPGMMVGEKGSTHRDTHHPGCEGTLRLMPSLRAGSFGSHQASPATPRPELRRHAEAHAVVAGGLIWVTPNFARPRLGLSHSLPSRTVCLPGAYPCCYSRGLWPRIGTACVAGARPRQPGACPCCYSRGLWPRIGAAHVAGARLGLPGRASGRTRAALAARRGGLRGWGTLVAARARWWRHSRGFGRASGRRGGSA
jgi:hypothetical protein